MLKPLATATSAAAAALKTLRVLAAASSPLVVVIATSKATSKSYKAACTLSLATCLPSLPSDKCLKAAFAAATSLPPPMSRPSYSSSLGTSCPRTRWRRRRHRWIQPWRRRQGGCGGDDTGEGRRRQLRRLRKEVVAKASRATSWSDRLSGPGGVGGGGAGELEDEDPARRRGERPRRHHTCCR